MSNDLYKEYEWMFPPKDPSDPQAWDKFWLDQLDHGMGPDLYDMFCNDESLLDLARKYDLSTVLCVGNGISQEALALSKAGLHVTALDISPMSADFCEWMRERLESTESFFNDSYLRDGGSASFVVGDLFDPEACPGPYDIVIERRTIQDYPESEHERAIRAVLDRLAKPGIFLCHCHDNQWNPIKNPDTGPRHATRDIVAGQRVEFFSDPPPEKLTRQTAIIFTTSG